MAIKKSKVSYVTDTGREFELHEMTASHLMNAIAHHRKQIEGLSNYDYSQALESVFIKDRIIGLHETVQLLMAELATRDPSKDESTSNDKWHG